MQFTKNIRIIPADIVATCINSTSVATQGTMPCKTIAGIIKTKPQSRKDTKQHKDFV